MNYKYLLILLLALLVLSGCSAEAESDGSTSADNRSTEELVYSRLNVESPKGVESELISEEFHNEMKEYFRLDAEFAKKDEEFEEKLNSFSDEDIEWEKEFREEYIEHLDGYSIHLNSVNIPNSTDEEYKLTSYINGYGHLKMSSKIAMKEYLETMNENKLDESSRYNIDSLSAMDDVVSLLEEYQMYE